MKRPISPDTTSASAARDDDDDSAPPLPKSTKNYVTPTGFKRLKDEALHLLDKERPDLVKVVQWAASNGDRSENADYIYGKRRLREIDRRIRFLTKRLDAAVVVDPAGREATDQVFFGATVTVIHNNGVIFSAQSTVVPVFVNGLSYDIVGQVLANFRGRGKAIIVAFGERLDLGEELRR